MCTRLRFVGSLQERADFCKALGAIPVLRQYYCPRKDRDLLPFKCSGLRWPIQSINLRRPKGRIIVPICFASTSSLKRQPDRSMERGRWDD